MQLTISHAVVLISRPVPQAEPATEINAQTLAAHFFGDIQRKIVRLEGDLGLRLLKILDFKGEDAIHKRFRFAAASSETPVCAVGRPLPAPLRPRFGRVLLKILTTALVLLFFTILEP